MWTDVTDCYAFYETSLGEIVEKAVTEVVASFWPSVKGEVVAGFGYTHPFLPYFTLEADRVLSLMPAPMGVMSWPEKDKNASMLVCEKFPFRNESIHKLLVVHAFEHIENTSKILEEFWRVLAPEGRLLIVVPNRRGLWSRTSHTPFGNGHPYTGRQLFTAVEQSHFVPQKPRYALFHPPAFSSAWERLDQSMEQFGEKWFKKFGGVVVLEARKKVRGLVRERQKTWRPRIFVPKPSVSCCVKSSLDPKE